MRDLATQLREGEGFLIFYEEGSHGEGLQLQGTEEMTLLLRFPAYLIQLAPEGSEENHDIVLLRQMLQQTQDLGCMHEVQSEDHE